MQLPEQFLLSKFAQSFWGDMVCALVLFPVRISHKSSVGLCLVTSTDFPFDQPYQHTWDHFSLESTENVTTSSLGVCPKLAAGLTVTKSYCVWSSNPKYSTSQLVWSDFNPGAGSIILWMLYYKSLPRPTWKPTIVSWELGSRAHCTEDPQENAEDMDASLSLSPWLWVTDTVPQSGWSWQAPLVHPYLQQNPLDLVAQDHIQVDFGYVQGQRPYNLSRQPVLVPGQLHRNSTIFNFVSVLCTLPPVTSLCTTEKTLAHSSRFPIRCLYTLERSPWVRPRPSLPHPIQALINLFWCFALCQSLQEMSVAAGLGQLQRNDTHSMFIYFMLYTASPEVIFMTWMKDQWGFLVTLLLL